MILKDYLSRCDVEDIEYSKNRGEFSFDSDESFNRHIKRLIRAVENTRKLFPCLKAEQFISYVLSQENFRYADTRKLKFQSPSNTVEKQINPTNKNRRKQE